jgi:DNA-directed RNA polymerase specialized sigma24 family protein
LLKPHIEALHEKRMTFAEFERATRAEWTKVARWLHRRWPVPLAVEDEDLVQQLLLAAWRAVGFYDPSRGVAVKAFVFWSAVTDTKRWINEQRGALRRSDRAQSRHDVAACCLRELEDGDGGQWAFDEEAHRRWTEEAAGAGEEVDLVRLVASLPPLERHAALAILEAGEAGKAAVERLESVFPWPLAPEEARRLVREAGEQLALASGA